MGAANPIEWVLPPVAITHEIGSGGAALAHQPKAARALAAPGSPLAEKDPFMPEPAPAPTLGTPIPTPAPSADDERLSRSRALEAQRRLGNYSTRASDQLTHTGSLG